VRQDAVVDLLPCGHVAYASTSRLCPHLIGGDGEEHVRLLTGRGIDSDLCCQACDRKVQAGEAIELVVACQGCVGRCSGDDWSNVVGWRGVPVIADRPEPLDATVSQTVLPVRVADIAPVTAERGSVWLVLTGDGQVGRFDADQEAWEPLARCTVPDEPDRQPWAGHRLLRRLHCSADGRYAAVVNDFGRYGQVLDLASSQVTMTIDGGDYHNETVPLSIAFAVHDSRAVVIHRTAWNRLDISDPATGRLLTPREPTSYRHGEPRPEHYLDYFHGRLQLSPGGRCIADDGWVWHPDGMPVVWNVDEWLQHNVWESEDGPSRVRLCYRAYHWNSPMCWLDDERVVISGIGDDDEAMLAGVRVFHALTGTELICFPGPAGDLFADAARLYSAGPTGLEVWDPVTGHRTGAIAGFIPTHQHSSAGELVAIDGTVLRRWKIR